jgi:mycothiol system anti-sigma-R factor
MSESTNPFTTLTGKKPTCMEMLQFILDGQATPEQKEYFRSHMDQCMPCFKSYHLDMAIKELVQTKCCAGEAPTELVTSIKSQIDQKIS